MSEAMGPSAAEELRSFVARLERLQEEKSALQAEITEVFAEAKSRGFDTKALRQVLKERKLDEHDRREQEEILDLYRAALGMLGGTPLGDAALQRAAAE